MPTRQYRNRYPGRARNPRPRDRPRQYGPRDDFGVDYRERAQFDDYHRSYGRRPSPRDLRDLDRYDPGLDRQRDRYRDNVEKRLYRDRHRDNPREDLEDKLYARLDPIQEAFDWRDKIDRYDPLKDALPYDPPGRAGPQHNARKAFSYDHRASGPDPYDGPQERRGGRGPGREAFSDYDPRDKEVIYYRGPREIHRSYGRREWDQVSIDDSVVDYGRGDRSPSPVEDSPPNWSFGDPTNPGNRLLAAEDLEHSRRQKFRVWSEWRADLNDHLLGGHPHRFRAIPNRAPRLPKVRDPEDLMSYAAADNSGTRMEEGHFLRIGIPRVQGLRHETLDEATRMMERDVRNLQFNKTPRLWVSKGFGKELAMNNPQRQKRK